MSQTQINPLKGRGSRKKMFREPQIEEKLHYGPQIMEKGMILFPDLKLKDPPIDNFKNLLKVD